MRVAVTGGKGFLGSHIVQRLRLEHEVTSLDRPGWDLLWDDPPACDALVHAAAVADPQGRDPDAIWTTNVGGTKRLLERTLGLTKTVLFVSTTAVYGDDTDEGHEVAPGTLYGASKLAGEGLVSAWAAKTGGRRIVLRPVQIYGSGYTRGHVRDFVERYRRDGRVQAFDSGVQRRDGVHADDVADAVALLLERGAGVYDIAGESWGWRDTARVMGIEVTPGAPWRGFAGDALRHHPVMSSRLAQLGWFPHRTVEDGVREALAGLGWTTAEDQGRTLRLAPEAAERHASV